MHPSSTAALSVPFEAKDKLGPFRIKRLIVVLIFLGLTVSPGELPGEATEMGLELGSVELTKAISQALEQYCLMSFPSWTAISAFPRSRSSRVMPSVRGAPPDEIR